MFFVLIDYSVRLFTDRLYFSSDVFRNFQKHIVEFVRVNACFVLFVLLLGIFFGFVECDTRHLVLRFANHGRIKLFIGKKVVEVYIAYHCRFQKIDILVAAVSVVAYKHVSGNADKYRLDVDGTE